MENITKFVSQDNALTLSRHNFKILEKRCLYFIIQEVRRLYIETNEGNRDLFDNMYLTIQGKDLQKLGDETKDVYKALKALADAPIEIETEDEWIYTKFVLQAKHEKKADVYRVDISRDILPYLVELAEHFTTYNLIVAMTLKSTYSQRFYEFCCMYLNRPSKSFFITVKDLRTMLKLENKKSYENTAIIKRDILEVARKEIKDLYDAGKCELYFDYRVKDTDKRKILSYWFFIKTREDERKRATNYANAEKSMRKVIEIVESFIKRDNGYIKRVSTAMQMNPDIASPILEKLYKIINKYTKNDIPRLIRYALSEDFDIK